MIRHGSAPSGTRTATLRVTIPHVPFSGILVSNKAPSRSFLPESRMTDQLQRLSTPSQPLPEGSRDAPRINRKAKSP
jgi:hypothetical protein